ncbi:hypothetical protein H2198_009637 [Neophaeococcomyces mojaviensis]|uniref:Uncharacterized protein n=1 Tax=Neophaeococcomyces mojaviensis TaxID=3383035 RepID=A0ACC2ZTW7_9EURO|nr:hypothetical protein H2198_009637 [Knufia sp. JES_112]
MSAAAHENERPAKRQKIDATPLIPTNATSISGYLNVASHSYPVQISNPEVYKSLHTKESPGNVELLNCSQSGDTYCARLRIPWLKITAEAALTSAVPADINLLKSCVQVPSIISGAKKIASYPLARCDARLRLQGHQPVIDVCLLWRDTADCYEKIPDHLRSILKQVFSTGNQEDTVKATSWDVKEFYDNVHVPDMRNAKLLDIQPAQCTLYPFQDRATRWMLSREGVEIPSNGQVALTTDARNDLPLDFQAVELSGQRAFVSHALSVVSTSRADIEAQYRTTKGGLLAEAMGLGKTVEMIALMCLHKKDKSPTTVDNPGSLRSTGATLIITPPTILEQWKQEICEHAPSLRVFHYTGIKSAGKQKEKILDLLSEQDVVLTTYNVIASELHYVQERPDRNLRNRPRREPPKSPLTQLLWWRCLLDEAQMVESGVSNAAIVARLIPRVNAWAVTGTPLKQSHRDLYGLLLFLNYEPWCQSIRMWDHLVFYHRDLFKKLIGSVALRHSKELVRDELRIPPQSRCTVNIPFTAIEESHYAQMHFDMQQDCGFDKLGAPLAEDWDPNSSVVIERMRSWLQRLRQTCSHPEVGGRNRKALGRRDGPLRTVAQVLDVMIEQIESTVHTEQRNMLMYKADRARILEHARQSQTAQDIFKEAYVEASNVVADCRKEVEMESKKLSTLETSKKEDETDAETDDEVDAEAFLMTTRQRLRSALEAQHLCIFFIGNTYYQLKEHEELTLLELQRPQEENESALAPDHHQPGTGNTADGNLATNAPGMHTTKLDSAQEAGIKAKMAELERLEAESYEQAKKIRTELLAEVHRKANRRIKTIRAKKESGTFAVIPDLDFSDDDFGGIESRKVFEKLYHYCKAMNEQAKYFQETRTKMTDMLCRTLVDEEEGVELTGEEYEDSTKHQDEMYVMMEMLRALFADRNDAITGQENLLLRQETKQFLKDAKEGKGPAPELMISLLAERQKVRIDTAQQGSLRGLVTEVRSLTTSLEWQEGSSERARAELVIVNNLLQHVQKLLSTQTRSISALEQEVNQFRDSMNARLDYYRALQKISDMVAPIGEEDQIGKPVDQQRIERFRLVEDAAAKKLSVAQSKKRYLLHLKHESEVDGNAKICTICQFEFEIGTLTVCGHQFCKECITMWWSEHRNCPVCKRRLQLADFHDVTYKLVESGKHSDSEGFSSESLVKSIPSQGNSIYTTIPPSMLQEIKNIDIRGGSYGSKVDTLVRHIIYLRQRDPGSKAIVFSQYRDFLDVISRSLSQNQIIHSKFDDKNGIIDFKSNPANECFLLHAKAHAAGLNLVCASHVILCEPLINTAIELQAVARVHRIGQLRETTVWMYLINDTVEEAIYDISVKRRLAHMDSEDRDASRSTSRAVTPRLSEQKRENNIEAANAKELQAADLSKMFAAGRTGGELVDKEDLWECLFGNVQNNKSITGPRPSRGLADLTAGSSATEPGSEIGRFLRAEAAEGRRR